MKYLFLFSFCLLLIQKATTQGTKDSALQEVRIESVYSSKEHCAFTDLTYYRGIYYMVFREAADHRTVSASLASNNLVVMQSRDLHRWRIEKKIRIDSVDLRDPKLMVVQSGSRQDLYVTTFGVTAYVSPSRIKGNNYYIRKSAGGVWETPVKYNVSDSAGNTLWLWRPVFSKGKISGIAYRFYKDNASVVYKVSGKTFSDLKVGAQLELKGIPTEATLRFDGGHELMVVRRETTKSVIGIRSGINDRINWKDIPTGPIGGPNFLLLGKKNMIIAGRIDGAVKLWVYNLQTYTLLREIDLPAGQETGYPGLLKVGNKVYVSYYVINNGISEIKLASFMLRNNEF